MDRHRILGLMLVVAVLCTPFAGRASAASPAAATGATTPNILNTVTFRTIQQGWLGGAQTILATSDGGATWTRRYSGPATIRQFSFVSADVGWAMGRGALLHTLDGGKTWSTVHKPPHALQQIAFVTPTRGWAIAGPGPTLMRLYVTADGGNTWTLQPLSIPIGAVCFSDPAHGWAARAFSAGMAPVTLLATADGGATWRPVQALTAAEKAGGFEGQTLGCPAQGTIWDLVDFGGYAGGAAYALYRGADNGSSGSRCN